MALAQWSYRSKLVAGTRLSEVLRSGTAHNDKTPRSGAILRTF
jgi:hypothetical protein